MSLESWIAEAEKEFAAGNTRSLAEVLASIAAAEQIIEDYYAGRCVGCTCWHEDKAKCEAG